MRVRILQMVDRWNNLKCSSCKPVVTIEVACV